VPPVSVLEPVAPVAPVALPAEFGLVPVVLVPEGAVPVLLPAPLL
jgi:hypothetical protein